MKGVIRLGDPLLSGGKVITASGADFMGKKVMLQQDLVACPIPGHGVNPVSECCTTWTMNGKGVVVDGCKASCSCIIRTTLPQAGTEK